MLKIVHVTAGNLFGGIERMLLAVVSAATDECRHEVAVSFNGALAADLRSAGAAPHVLGDVRFRRPDSVWRARRALRTLIAQGGYDAVVAHAPWSSVLAAPVARRAGVPLLLWIHDAPHAEQWPERRVARMPPDRFICNSRYTADLVARWMPATPRSVIHPAVVVAPTHVRSGHREALRHAHGAGPATTVVLLAARMEEWKGHRALIEATRYLRGDVSVWIAGGPQRATEMPYYEDLKQLAADSATRARVHLLGHRTDVAALMAASDVYCQPNTAPEPFGVVLVEALASGLPVITAASGGALEIVDERCGVLLPDSSPGRIAAAVQHLVDDRSARARLAAAGPARARLVSEAGARVRELADVVRQHRQRSSAA